MKLQALTEKIREALGEAVKNAIIEGRTDATVTVSTSDGYIDMTVYRKGFASALANHDNVWRKYNLHRLNEFAEKVAEDYCGEVAWLEAEEELLSKNAPTPEEEYFMSREPKAAFYKRAAEVRERLRAAKKRERAA